MKVQKNIAQTATAFQTLLPWSQSGNHFWNLFGDMFMIWIKSQKNAVLNSMTILSQAQTKASNTRKTLLHSKHFFFFNQGKMFIGVQCPGPAWKTLCLIFRCWCPCSWNRERLWIRPYMNSPISSLAQENLICYKNFTYIYAKYTCEVYFYVSSLHIYTV